MSASLSGGVTHSHTPALVRGMRDGIPIGLGYLAVAFSLGIAARNAGLNAFQGFLVSILNNASAGEYAGFTTIAADASYLEIAIVTLIANARYLLMSCSLSQKFAPDTPLRHRLLVGYDVTDELFGLAISYDGWLDPHYMYGAILVAAPSWAVGIQHCVPLRLKQMRSFLPRQWTVFMTVIRRPIRMRRSLTVSAFSRL